MNMKMESFKVCRICLITDVKMFNFQSPPLSTYFNSVCGDNIVITRDIPEMLCYECATLVKKYYMFKKKSVRGQEALSEIFNLYGMISSCHVASARQKYELSSSYSLHTIQESSIICYTHADELNKLDIKLEIDIDEDHLIPEVEFLKGEDLKSHSPISSDDEPLSLHISNRDRSVEKKEVETEKNCDEDLNALQLQNFEATDEVDTMETVEEIATKRKRGRPRKVKREKGKVLSGAKKRAPKTGLDAEVEDLESYVTVMTLSVEQQMEEITSRLKSSNYLNATYKCELCYKGFVDSDAWDHHRAKHDPSAGDIECPICKLRYTDKRKLQKHAINHEKKYACKACSFVSKTSTQAKQHQKWHRGVTYKCKYCDEISLQWTSHLSHIRYKHPSVFICNYCGYSFVSQLGLAMHKTMMHKDKEQESVKNEESLPYCKVCDVKFVSEEAWKRHLITSANHSGGDDFKNGCRVCGDVFKDAEELRVHHRKEHARKRPRNYGKKIPNEVWPRKCINCPEEIANARDYWNHFRREHPDKQYPIDKNYVCDICGKSFRGNAFLVYHKRTHFEERAYKCAQCPKAFHNRNNLQVHEKTHSDNRPYPCSMCFKAFKSKGALDRHYRSHTGDKPYQCDVCGKSFGQSNSRKIHLYTVHLKQPAPYISRTRLDKQKNRIKAPAQPYAY